jgi:hypothetical protein
MTSLDLIAASRAEEAGYLALADIARLAEQTGIDYRIVGGQMVGLHVAASGAEDPALRQTLDADLGVGHQVAGDPALVDGLEGLGYERPESANRFVRTAPGGQRLVIDLLAPSYGSRMQTNRRHGQMTVDEIPGLSFALALPGERVELHVRLLDDSTIDLITVIPEITAALCVKVLGYADRLAAKDALDVWRLLAAYRMRVPAPLPWRDKGVQGDAAKILRLDFGQVSGGGVRAAASSLAEHAQIRALVLHALGR